MPPRLVTEIEAAHLAGFRRWRDFQAARRRDQFPRPDLELGDGPRWSETKLRRWIDGEPDQAALSDEERKLIGRLEGHEAAPPGRQGPPRR